MNLSQEEIFLQYDELVEIARLYDLDPPSAPIQTACGLFILKNWPYVRKYLKSQNQRFIYMLTCTLGPSNQGKADLLEQDIIALTARANTLGIIRLYYVKELTRAGIPHFHVGIEATKSIKKNRFITFTRKYGNIDLSRTRGKTLDSVLKYLSKENQPVQLI